MAGSVEAMSSVIDRRGFTVCAPDDDDIGYEAERLLMRGSNSNGDVLDADTVLGAQVHATLALAAATVVIPATRMQVEWLKTVGPQETRPS